MFYDCRGPRVLIGDQAKGLVFFIESKAEERKAKGKELIFQLCEKHAADNITVKVKRVAKYNEDKVLDWFIRDILSLQHKIGLLA